MTVSEFAISMHHCDIVKDEVNILCDGKIIYNDRMEFLRYANDEGMECRLWFADEIVEEVTMKAKEFIPGEVPDYITTLKIRDTRKERGVDL